MLPRHPDGDGPLTVAVGRGAPAERVRAHRAGGVGDEFGPEVVRVEGRALRGDAHLHEEGLAERPSSSIWTF